VCVAEGNLGEFLSIPSTDVLERISASGAFSDNYITSRSSWEKLELVSNQLLEAELTLTRIESVKRWKCLDKCNVFIAYYLIRVDGAINTSSRNKWSSCTRDYPVAIE